MSVNIHEAKTHLSRLIERASAGETIVIARAGKPVAKLTRFEEGEARGAQRLGFLEGAAVLPLDFDTWAEDELRGLFEGTST